MGMFDTITFLCPQCKESLEVQSKAGDCLLNDFNFKEVPILIAEDIKGEKVYCGNCDLSFKIELDDTIPKTVRMRLS